jgi:hypothetical protein
LWNQWLVKTLYTGREAKMIMCGASYTDIASLAPAYFLGWLLVGWAVSPRPIPVVSLCIVRF